MGKGTRRGESMQSAPIEGFGVLETGTVVAYGALYHRIFWDLEQAETELGGPRIDYANLIHAAAHLRLVIEQVTMASFVASHTLISEAGTAVSNSRQFDSARKVLKKLNPHYWPVAFGVVTHNGSSGLGVRPEVGLQESEIGRYFGSVSEVLHAQSPYVLKKRRPEPDEHHAIYRELAIELRTLLDEHVVQLAGHPEYLRFRHLDGENRVEAIRTQEPLLGPSRGTGRG